MANTGSAAARRRFKLNRRVLLGGVLIAAAGASVASAHLAADVASARGGAADTGPFRLSDAAQTLRVGGQQVDARRAALDAIPGPTNRDEHTDASPEWLQARDRWAQAIQIQSELSERIAEQAAREPITLDSLLTLALAARNYPMARNYLTEAVARLAGLRDHMSKWLTS
jgi:hypothetical protein